MAKAIDKGNLWWVGVLIYMMSASLMALGIALQKYSLVEEKKRYNPPRPRWQSGTWILGLGFYVLSSVGMGASLNFAAQSLLSPMRAIMIAANAALGRFFLGEHFGVREGLSTGIIISGIAVTTVFGDKEVASYSAAEMRELYSADDFLVFVGLVFVLVLTLLGMNWRFRANTDDKGCTPASRLLPFTYGALGGTFGGVAAVLTKSAITVVVEEAKEGFWHMLSQWLVWVILTVLCTSYVLQIYWINRGLDEYDAVFLVPIEASFDATVGTIGGLLYFQEHKALNQGELLGFGAGLVVAQLGVLLMALKPLNVAIDPLDEFAQRRCCGSGDGRLSAEEQLAGSPSINSSEQPLLLHK